MVWSVHVDPAPSSSSSNSTKKSGGGGSSSVTIPIPESQQQSNLGNITVPLYNGSPFKPTPTPKTSGGGGNGGFIPQPQSSVNNQTLPAEIVGGSQVQRFNEPLTTQQLANQLPSPIKVSELQRYIAMRYNQGIPNKEIIKEVLKQPYSSLKKSELLYYTKNKLNELGKITQVPMEVGLSIFTKTGETKAYEGKVIREPDYTKLSEIEKKGTQQEQRIVDMAGTYGEDLNLIPSNVKVTAPLSQEELGSIAFGGGEKEFTRLSNEEIQSKADVIYSEEQNKLQPEFNEKIKIRTDYYQGKINAGTLTVEEAQAKLDKEIEVMNKDYSKRLNDSAQPRIQKEIEASQGKLESLREKRKYVEAGTLFGLAAATTVVPGAGLKLLGTTSRAGGVAADLIIGSQIIKETPNLIGSVASGEFGVREGASLAGGLVGYGVGFSMVKGNYLGIGDYLNKPVRNVVAERGVIPANAAIGISKQNVAFGKTYSSGRLMLAQSEADIAFNNIFGTRLSGKSFLTQPKETGSFKVFFEGEAPKDVMTQQGLLIKEGDLIGTSKFTPSSGRGGITERIVVRKTGSIQDTSAYDVFSVRPNPKAEVGKNIISKTKQVDTSMTGDFDLILTKKLVEDNFRFGQASFGTTRVARAPGRVKSQSVILDTSSSVRLYGEGPKTFNFEQSLKATSGTTGPQGLLSNEPIITIVGKPKSKTFFEQVLASSPKQEPPKVSQVKKSNIFSGPAISNQIVGGLSSTGIYSFAMPEYERTKTKFTEDGTYGKFNMGFDINNLPQSNTKVSSTLINNESALDTITPLDVNKTITGVTNLPDQREKNKERNRGRSSGTQINNLITNLNLGEDTSVRPRQSEGTKLEQRQIQSQVQDQVQVFGFGFGFTGKGYSPKPYEPNKPTKIRTSPDDSNKRERGFLTFVKTGKGYTQVSSKPLPESSAVALGARITDVTLAKTFKVVPTKTTVKSPKKKEAAPLFKFRTFKQVSGKKIEQPRIYIEKQKYSLEPGEQTKIRPVKIAGIKKAASSRRSNLGIY